MQRQTEPSCSFVRRSRCLSSSPLSCSISIRRFVTSSLLLCVTSSALFFRAMLSFSSSCIRDMTWLRWSFASVNSRWKFSHCDFRDCLSVQKEIMLLGLQNKTCLLCLQILVYANFPTVEDMFKNSEGNDVFIIVSSN